jgi:uncharacterized surface protein with fasciclin (FAS1) repeats
VVPNHALYQAKLRPENRRHSLSQIVPSRIRKADYIGTKNGMKRKGLIILAAVGGLTLTLHGQDAAPPSVDLFEEGNQPAQTPTPSPEPNGPDIPELSQLDQAFKQTSLGKQADQYRVHIQWRQLKNQVVNDPQVQAAKASTGAARTDLERRNRFRDYYNIYYQRMLALASTPEMKASLEALKNSHVGLLAQPRVRPSPSASATPGKLTVANVNSLDRTNTPSRGSASTQANEDIDAIAAARGSLLTRFVAALNLTHKTETLKTAGPVTMFVPTDGAFENAPSGTIDTTAHTERLSKLLDYHIVKGAIPSNELTTRKLTTLNGASLDVKVKNGKITVNDAHVIRADVKTSDGVIYLIDKVLVPPAE